MGADASIGPILYRPDEHEPVTAEPWDEERVRAAIAAVVSEAEAALPDDGLWPENDQDVDEGDLPPFTVVYLGAAGVAWELRRARLAAGRRPRRGGRARHLRGAARPGRGGPVHARRRVRVAAGAGALRAGSGTACAPV